MNIKKMVLSVIILSLSYAVAAFAQSSSHLTHVAGEVYTCRTSEQASEQHVNPDYLVPGCRIYMPSPGTSDLRTTKPNCSEAETRHGHRP
jgi:hypothetical protein